MNAIALGYCEEAEADARQTLQMATDMNIRHDIPFHENMIGLSLLYRNRVDEALSAFQEALTVARADNHLRALGAPLLNLAHLYRLTGQLDIAHDFAHEAIATLQASESIDTHVAESTAAIIDAALAYDAMGQANALLDYARASTNPDRYSALRIAKEAASLGATLPDTHIQAEAQALIQQITSFMFATV